MEKMMRMILLKNQAVIEEVNDRDLEKLVEENDFVAVAWFNIIKILKSFVMCYYNQCQQILFCN